MDLAAVKEAIKQDSRRYAKRQLTWFRNRMAPYWVNLVQQPEQLATLKYKYTNGWRMTMEAKQERVILVGVKPRKLGVTLGNHAGIKRFDEDRQGNGLLFH